MTEQMTLAEAQAEGERLAIAAEAKLNETQRDMIRESMRRYLEQHEYLFIDWLWDWFEKDRPGLHPGKYIGPAMQYAQQQRWMTKVRAYAPGLDAHAALPSKRSHGAPKWLFASLIKGETA